MLWPEFDWEFKPAVQSRVPAIRVVLVGSAVALMGGTPGYLLCYGRGCCWEFKFVSHWPLV